ncbi:dUTP diphosphatase [Candidatus Woesearchaeota archaeon]|jgi:dUTP pyrophosphatase|nr:dUTP diphosphatase [Candidatus Woesearchaeota archaeon]MBT4322018.1 dUTP diphosphatase [Candidatus Woesearchaeota archaeon]MBT4630764.1 dUTP diphosphatase [Candidatus Woesearchaeota archaeon]
MKVKFKKLHEDAISPKYAKEGDAGLDLHSIEEFTLKPNETRLTKTGLAIQLPRGYVSLIWPKSGLASKHSIHIMGGVIDADYRGEYGVIIKNLGHEDFQVTKGMRIAQLLIQQVIEAKLEEVNDLDETERGDGAFGHTGI